MCGGITRTPSTRATSASWCGRSERRRVRPDRPLRAADALGTYRGSCWRWPCCEGDGGGRRYRGGCRWRRPRSPRREERERGGGRIVGRELLVDDELEIGNRRKHERIPSPVRHAAEGDERNPLLGRDARHGGRLHVLDDGAAALTRSERLEELQKEVRVHEGGGVRPDARHPRRRATRCTPEKITTRGEARNRSTPVGIGAVPLVAAVYPELGIFDAYRRAELRAQPRAGIVLHVQIRIEGHVSGEAQGNRIQTPAHGVRRIGRRGVLQAVRPVIGDDDVSDVVAAAGDAGEDDGLHSEAAVLEIREHRSRGQVGIHEADAGHAHDDVLPRDGPGEEPPAVEDPDFRHGRCGGEELRALRRVRGEDEDPCVARPGGKAGGRKKRAGCHPGGHCEVDDPRYESTRWPSYWPATFLQYLDHPPTGSGYARKLGQIAHERRLHRSTTLDKTPFHSSPNPAQLMLEVTCMRRPADQKAGRRGGGGSPAAMLLAHQGRPNWSFQHLPVVPEGV